MVKNIYYMMLRGLIFQSFYLVESDVKILFHSLTSKFLPACTKQLKPLTFGKQKINFSMSFTQFSKLRPNWKIMYGKPTDLEQI